MTFQRLHQIAFSLLALCCPLLGSGLLRDLDQLDVTSPEMVLHLNLEDDFAALGSQLGRLYGAWLMSGPEVPPVPLDFPRLFDRLGFNALSSVTLVSEPHPRSGYLNQSLVRFKGAPSGLFLLQGSENRSFSVARYAPADADLALEFSLNSSEALRMLRTILSDLMGPLGQGLLDAQLGQPLVPEGPTLENVIQRLNTRLMVVARVGTPDEASILGPEAPPLRNLVIRAAGIGDLLDAFAPLLQAAGYSRLDESDELAWVRSVQEKEFLLDLRLSRTGPDQDLVLMLGKDTPTWMKGGTRLGDDALYLEFTQDLPTEGLGFWYHSAGFGAAQVGALVSKSNPQNALIPLRQTIASMMDGLSGQQASVMFMDQNALRVMAFQPVSYPSGLAFGTLALIPAILEQ